jgi:hypothetical protein
MVPVKGNSGAWRLPKGQMSRILNWRGRWRKRRRRVNVIWYVSLHSFKPTYSTLSPLRGFCLGQ